MTPLGKPLVFHLKYMAEMNRLYGHVDQGELPKLTGLDDAEQVVKMVRTVGAEAYEQAADFLEECGKAVVDHFTSLGATIGSKTKRSYIVRNWYWYADGISHSSAPGGEFSFGLRLTAPPEVRVRLNEGEFGVVVAYVWSKG